jgi:hypothetical protein
MPAFERFDTCERRPGRKTLDPQAKSGDPAVKRQATWGMSDKVAAPMVLLSRQLETIGIPKVCALSYGQTTVYLNVNSKFTSH